MIETEILECEWIIPEPPGDEKFDRDKVNVQFSPTASDTDTEIFGRVGSADDCGTLLGWYYDNPEAPTRIIACPEACNAIQTAEKARVDIVLGCQTIVVE